MPPVVWPLKVSVKVPPVASTVTVWTSFWAGNGPIVDWSVSVDVRLSSVWK